MSNEKEEKEQKDIDLFSKLLGVLDRLAKAVTTIERPTHLAAFCVLALVIMFLGYAITVLMLLGNPLILTLSANLGEVLAVLSTLIVLLCYFENRGALRARNPLMPFLPKDLRIDGQLFDKISDALKTLGFNEFSYGKRRSSKDEYLISYARNKKTETKFAIVWLGKDFLAECTNRQDLPVLHPLSYVAGFITNYGANFLLVCSDVEEPPIWILSEEQDLAKRKNPVFAHVLWNTHVKFILKSDKTRTAKLIGDMFHI